MNLLAGLFILMASAVATWLLLPALSAPYAATALPQTSLVVSIGPFQVNLMLIVLFVAAGAPFAAIVMALLVRWLSSIAVAPGGATASVATAPAKKAAAAPAASVEAVEQKELSPGQKLMWSAAILVALAVIVVLIRIVLPPGFALF